MMPLEQQVESKQEVLVVGLTTLSWSINQQQLQTYFPEAIMNIISDKEFKIQQDFIPQRWEERFTIIKEVRASELSLHKSQEPKCLQMIKTISFPNLKKIYLGYCNLTTIEALICLQAPILDTIFMFNNFIVDARSIRKTYFNNLMFLQISANKVKQWKWTQELQFSQDQVMGFKFEEFSHQDLTVQDISFLAKLTPPKIYEIANRNYDRILRNCVDYMIRKRNYGLSYIDDE